MGTRDRIARVAEAVRPLAGSPRWVPLLLMAVLATVATTAVAASTRSTPPAQPGGQPTDGVRDIAAVGLGRSVPVRILIPSIDVAADIVPLGLSGGELAALPDARQAGWYERGTSPGELGSAVLVGRGKPERPSGPAVFAGLFRLAAGDRIQVVRADGVVASFTVNRVERRGDACVSVPSGCAAEHAPKETGAEVELRLVSRGVVVWARLAI